MFMDCLHALRACDWESLNSLIGEKPVHDILDEGSGDDLMSLSIRLGHVKGVAFLFEKGFPSYWKDYLGRTLGVLVVRYAKRSKFPGQEQDSPYVHDRFSPCSPRELLEIMSLNGVSLMERDSNGTTAMDYAKAWGLIEFSLLLEAYALGLKSDTRKGREGL